MMTKREAFHERVFLIGLTLLLIGLPLSLFLMSVSQLLLTGNWLAEGKFKAKWQMLRRRPEVLVFLAIFLMHVLGLLHTIDFQYALKDLRTKLPLLALPIIFATRSPIKRVHLNVLLLAYTAAVLFGSLRSMAELAWGEVNDIREISVYISHIRFSLNICMAIFILVWMLSMEQTYKPWQKMGLLLIISWLVIFLFILQSMTGIVVFLLTAVILLVRHGIKLQDKRLRRLVFLSALMLPLVAILYVGVFIYQHARVEPVDFSALEEFSSQGERYHHDTLNCQTVNGHYVWIYIAENELRDAWNQRSELDFDGLDRQGHQLRDIILRYLTSQGMRKDADALARLSDAEIDIIEEGRANASCDGRNVVRSRLCEILWEYRNYQCTGDPSGHSVLMRYEYWKASWYLIRTHFWTGVGTGDMNLAFEDTYQEINTRLSPEWRLRSHNQFLSIFVGLGVFGLLVFVIAILQPVWHAKPWSRFLLTAFLSIVLLSMITEDTIESQAGVTFFALFYCLILFSRVEKDG